MSMGENIVSKIPTTDGAAGKGINCQRANLSCKLCLRLHKESPGI